MNDNAHKTSLASSTPEYALLEYELQVALKASSARIMAAYVVGSVGSREGFERRCKDILTLPAYVPTSMLTGVNTEEDVIRKGFTFPPGVNGLVFQVGSVPGAGDEGKSIRKVLFCKIGVGRSYPCSEERAQDGLLPAGYDSFLLKDASPPATPTYFIPSPSQILPLYLVHYEFSPATEQKSRALRACDNCESAPATLYCQQDAANLCQKCDDALHNSKLTARHTRTEIGKGSDVFGQCRHHPGKMIEFFCPNCSLGVCVFCKMVGHHANGENAKHPLLPISEAYQSVLHDSMKPSPLLTHRRAEISSQIAQIHSRATAVTTMGETLHQQLTEIYHRALAQVKDIVDAKLNILLGDELELVRQMSEVERVESFWKYLLEGDAMTLLFNWARHQKMVGEVGDFKWFKREIDVGLDAKITGQLSVTIDPDLPPSVTLTRPVTPPSRNLSRPSSLPNSLASSPAKNKSQTQSPLGGLAGMGTGLNLPRSNPKMRAENGEKRAQHRRISDFFAETLCTLDTMGLGDDDGYSDLSMVVN
ncbi:hypothetical protein BC832DRAFT_543324 [Gaertneriomyces semiglobifer]|nr:hypothetical protein BC832DRAFT_543324 [Gaertneriomyces semiglobifer]